MNRRELPNVPPNQTEEETEGEEIEDFERSGGREIKGLFAKPEQFSKLERDRDYEIASTNPAITADQPLEDFFIFVNPSGGTETRVVQPPHWRAISSPNINATLRITAEGGERNVTFYTANTKGVGYLKPTARNKTLDTMDEWVIEDQADEQISGYKVLGLSGEHEYLQGEIIEKSNFLQAQGLRCEVYWGLAKLKQVYYKGKLATIETLKRKKVILNRKNYIPEEGVRLFKTNDRVEEVYESDDRRRELFSSAFETFNKETKDGSFPFPKIQI